MMKKYSWLMLVLMAAGAGGCAPNLRGNTGQMPVYSVPVQEAPWIRDGNPIEFEGELWYPEDAVDMLLDSEVILKGEYRGVQIFVDKVDVRPFRSLYTKFGRNKFRIFKKRGGDD